MLNGQKWHNMGQHSDGTRDPVMFLGGGGLGRRPPIA